MEKFLKNNVIGILKFKGIEVDDVIEVGRSYYPRDSDVWREVIYTSKTKVSILNSKTLNFLGKIFSSDKKLEDDHFFNTIVYNHDIIDFMLRNVNLITNE